MSNEIEEIRSQIDGLVEKVADLAMQDLRDTISAGEEKSSFKEKQLVRVRRSLEKASHLLLGLEE
ncbi:MAG: hypothetical protein CL502_03610 [Actinobacteria bacterium]|jgi:hypothetical protein|nr:hypothetical protein [Actinomycetota bacterium]|tara:strand:+ start:936 stop:1130 length:195 start_codon:yes stop_codon:yes gene_type:complete